MEFAIQENTARFAEIARIMEVATDETDDMTGKWKTLSKRQSRRFF